MILIMAGGASGRWRGHLGYENKWDIVIDGETLLSRLTRQLNERNAFYMVKSKPHPWGVLSCLTEISPVEYLVIMVSDAYFTDTTIDRILSLQDDSYMFFGKSHSAIKGYPEIYALKYPTIQGFLGYSLMQRKRDMSKFHSLFRALPVDKKLWVETDGMTEDFDFPHDYTNWMNLYKKELPCEKQKS